MKNVLAFVVLQVRHSESRGNTALRTNIIRLGVCSIPTLVFPTHWDSNMRKLQLPSKVCY